MLNDKKLVGCVPDSGNIFADKERILESDMTLLERNWFLGSARQYMTHSNELQVQDELNVAE